jgi:hypothetical protein
MMSVPSYNEILQTVRSRFLLESEFDGWVMGFGGCARSKEPIAGWSDLDLILCPSKMGYYAHKLARSISTEVANEFGLPCTMIVVSTDTVQQRFNRINPFNSVLLNALSGRPGTSLLIVGQPQLATPEAEHESRNALSYMAFVESQLSRLFVEGTSPPDKSKLKRMLKWISSYFRCYLRSEGTIVGPYESTLFDLASTLGSEAVEFWQRTFELRHSWSTFEDGDCEPLFMSIFENFCTTLEVLNARRVAECKP